MPKRPGPKPTKNDIVIEKMFIGDKATLIEILEHFAPLGIRLEEIWVEDKGEWSSSCVYAFGNRRVTEEEYLENMRKYQKEIEKYNKYLEKKKIRKIKEASEELADIEKQLEELKTRKAKLKKGNKDEA